MEIKRALQQISSREDETYLGKLMFTRMPPGQCFFGKVCVSLSATPMGFGSIGPSV